MSAFIDQEPERFAVDLICRTLGSRRPLTTGEPRASGRRGPSRTSGSWNPSERSTPPATTPTDPRRTWKALLRSGEAVGRGRVERLMRTNGIQGAKRRGKSWRTTTPDPGAGRRRAPPRRDQRHPARRTRSSLRCPESFNSPSQMKRGNQEARTPRHPGRLMTMVRVWEGERVVGCVLSQFAAQRCTKPRTTLTLSQASAGRAARNLRTSGYDRS